MSFFDEPKNFGLAMVIVGLISAILGIAASIMEVIEPGDEMSMTIVIGGIGSFIYGLMIAGMGAKVRSGEISKKIQILGQFIAVVGAGFFVTRLFSGIGQFFDESVTTGLVTIIVGIIVAIIVVFVAKKIMDGNATTFDKIMWILLLVIFVVMIIVSFFGIFVAFTADGVDIITKILLAISSFCNVIIYVFLLITLLSADVKKEMGM